MSRIRPAPRAATARPSTSGRYGGRGFHTVLVGDGTSDRHGAAAADTVLARGSCASGGARPRRSRTNRSVGDVAEDARRRDLATPLPAAAEPGRPARTARGEAGISPRSARGARIGNVALESPVRAGPARGRQESASWRAPSRRRGSAPDPASSEGLVRGNRATLEYCAFEPLERPIGVQPRLGPCAVMAEATREAGPRAPAWPRP